MPTSRATSDPNRSRALRGASGLRIETYPSTLVDYILINSGSTTNKALANPALWEAARWLVDYDGLAKDLL